MKWFIALGVVLICFVAPVTPQPHHVIVFWTGEAIVWMTVAFALQRWWRTSQDY